MIAILILIATNVFTGVAALVFWVKAKERDAWKDLAERWKRAHDLAAGTRDLLMKTAKDLLSEVNERNTEKKP